MTSRNWHLGVVALAIVACSAPAVLRAQEKTPQVRLSGAWQVNPALSAPLARPGAGSDSQGNRRGGAGGTVQGGSDSNQPLMPGVKARIQLMDDLTEVPMHMTLIATADVINLIDEHGISRRFAPVNKFEKIEYGSDKPSFRTHWEGATLVQDINADLIEMTRTFETTPDGLQLTVTLTIRRQPDPKAMAAQGNRGDIRKYVYNRAG